VISAGVISARVVEALLSGLGSRSGMKLEFLLDIRSCSPKLSHTVDLAAMVTGPACLCLLFRFASFLLSPLNKFFLHSELQPTKLLLTQLSY